MPRRPHRTQRPSPRPNQLARRQFAKPIPRRNQPLPRRRRRLRTNRPLHAPLATLHHRTRRAHPQTKPLPQNNRTTLRPRNQSHVPPQRPNGPLHPNSPDLAKWGLRQRKTHYLNLAPTHSPTHPSHIRHSPFVIPLFVIRLLPCPPPSTPTTPGPTSTWNARSSPKSVA